MDDDDIKELIEECKYRIEKDKRRIVLDSILLLIVAYRNYFVYGDITFIEKYQLIARNIVTIVPACAIILRKLDKRLREALVNVLSEFDENKR